VCSSDVSFGTYIGLEFKARKNLRRIKGELKEARKRVQKREPRENFEKSREAKKMRS